MATAGAWVARQLQAIPGSNTLTALLRGTFQNFLGWLDGASGASTARTPGPPLTLGVSPMFHSEKVQLVLISEGHRSVRRRLGEQI